MAGSAAFLRRGDKLVVGEPSLLLRKPMVSLQMDVSILAEQLHKKLGREPVAERIQRNGSLRIGVV